PLVFAITPNSGGTGTIVNVTLTGTNFVSGATVAISPSPGITVSNITVASATSITATFAIAPNASQGLYNVTVSTPKGISGVMTFNVVFRGPTLVSIGVTSALQDVFRLCVDLRGTNLLDDATVAVSGTGVHVVDMGFAIRGTWIV